MADVPLDELEVGPSTMQFVLSLGVETVDELLALPAITGSQRVVAELNAAFAALGVHYKGQMTALPGPPVTVLPSDATITARLDAIDTWVAEHAPALVLWRPPAKRGALSKAEKALGRKLPKDYRAFLRAHDGQQPLTPMVANATLLAVDQVIERYTALAALDAHPGIPIGQSVGGRSYLCIDRDGAIVTFYIDDDAQERIADSFSGLLGLYYEQLQSGEVELT